MIKSELMTLWNVESWTVEPHGVYFVSRRLGTNRLEQEIIQKEIPQEESVVLTLTDIMLDKSGCYDAFALGYDIGESSAGHLYVLVSFDENFTAQQDVIYETL